MTAIGGGGRSLDLIAEGAKVCRAQLASEWKVVQASEDPPYGAFVGDHSNEGCSAIRTV
ncbi:hypothetical protein COMA1_11335 [Candidatus Nitrospira nitrosa]|uniref:Uncharacterized protein n=1 Tax=Candidatus Nitrospira nitrosa TaxID=1742972 RepID=A0A0S4L7V7_9BACT|nr:hypothetical protein COMA1_11335 [Candidatus Nitrospira nitrosa]